MKITILLIGKTDVDFIDQGFSLYLKRLSHYININVLVIPAIKDSSNLSPSQIKERETSLLLKSIPDGSTIVLLDEKGKELRSVDFSVQLQKWMNSGIKDLCFITGGAYGLSDEIKKNASYQLSLSRMTFTHQMIRLIFAEQLYRAFTIIRNEPYHNE
ncbi:MAG: 23S rRNA (pseudouridine(1915)-N(3))-methyltransferase RlmH [Bacteroidales bacterium]